MRGLCRRHFIVQLFVLWATREFHRSVLGVVECGVCDGMTIYHVMRALQDQYHFTGTLFDGWQGMQAEKLLPTERKAVGAHSILSFDTTKNIS